jgi:hypothetical protein
VDTSSTASVTTRETTTTVTAVTAEELSHAGYHNGLDISGAVGLALNPTAQIPNVGGVRVQGNFYELFRNDEFNDRARLFGVYAAGRPWKAPVEISGGIERLDVSSDDEPFEDELTKTGVSLGAKWQFWQNKSGDLFLAAGAGYSRQLYKNLNAYVVATKAFNVGERPIWGHLGVRYDRYKVNFGAPGDDDLSSNQASVYGGLEVPIDRRGRWSVAGELQSKNTGDDLSGDLGSKAPYSIALRYQQPNGFAASIGYARQGVLANAQSEMWDGRGSGFFATVGWGFGGVGE